MSYSIRFDKQGMEGEYPTLGAAMKAAKRKINAEGQEAWCVEVCDVGPYGEWFAVKMYYNYTNLAKHINGTPVAPATRVKREVQRIRLLAAEAGR